jgi:hypothetical protein
VKLRSFVVGISLIAGSLCATAGVATASQPVVPACVGSTFSQDVQALQANGTPPGTVVSGFARGADARPGLGDGIQSLQAGQVPDSTVANTCNG